MRKLYLTFSLMLCCPITRAQIVINEVMQSNIDCVMDDLNEFPDSWVELYNTGTSFVNTSTYSLGLTDNPEEAFPIPSVSLPPKAFMLIYCDKEGKNAHTNFRLESGKGGSIYLFDGQKVADSYVDMKKQPAPNVSYGRAEDGGSKIGYMLTPTPNTANKGGIVDNKKILGEPVFSIPGSIYTQNTRIVVKLSLPEDAPEGTVIRYTLDGTEPTQQSMLYEKSFSSTGSTMIIRAKLFCDGYLSPRSVTHSYIFLGRNMTIPIISISTDNKYFYDNKLGIYVDGSYKQGTKNFSYDWRRPINLEYFDAAGSKAAINQLCETRVQGGQSRNCQIKSLAIYANKRFGEKRFGYEFFPTEKPGITEFKSLILRNAGNDFDYMYFRDAAIQHNAGTNCDIDWQGWQPTAVFINGTYLGMLNVRERSNDDNIYSNYDGLEDIDVVENYYDLKAGTMDAFNKFKDFYTASANSENTNMDNYASMLDIDEYINIMAVNTFQNNLDFPGNNIEWWRPRTEDGKWRIIMKDTDFGLGLYGRSSEYKYIDWLYNHDYDTGNQWANDYEHTRLFRRLMTDQRFKDRFIDRMTVFMGSFLNGNGLGEVIDSMYNVIKTEYPNHRKLINQWWPNHKDEINSAKNWAVKRTNFMKTYLKDYFKISGTLKTCMVNSGFEGNVADYNFKLNDTWLKTGKYSGSLFSGREVKLAAEPREGAEAIVGWKILINRAGKTEEKTLQGSSVSFVYPTDASVVTVNAFTEAIGIENVFAGNNSQSDSSTEKIYTLDGKQVAAPNKSGVFIIRRGNSVKKIIK